MKNTKNKKVCVFLSASDVPIRYKKPALDLVKKLILNDYTFVYGGSERGLMKEAADLVRSCNGKIVAVVSEEFRSVWRDDVDEKIICQNIPDRKKKILEVSDVIVVLPGGTGTLDELLEAVETKKWGNHKKEIIIMNTANYWDNLLKQLELIKKEGFINVDFSELFYVADNPDEVLKYINSKSTL